MRGQVRLIGSGDVYIFGTDSQTELDITGKWSAYRIDLFDAVNVEV
jgi:hypothetical protein